MLKLISTNTLFTMSLKDFFYINNKYFKILTIDDDDEDDGGGGDDDDYSFQGRSQKYI